MREIKRRVKREVVKKEAKPLGRPQGSGGGQKLTTRLNFTVCKALDILQEKYDTNLETLIADKLYEDAPAVLSKIQKILPAPDVTINHQHSAFINALSSVAELIEEKAEDEQIH